MTRTQPTDTSQSFEKSAIPLLLALKPSRIQQSLSVVCHGLAIIAVFLSNIPLAIQLAITIAIVISLRYNHRHGKQPQTLIWRAGNRWVIEIEPPSPDADQQSPSPGTASAVTPNTIAAELRSIDFFSRWLVILTLRTEADRNEKFVIPYDALSENTFRLLRVRLRIEGFSLLNPEKKP